MFKLLIVLRTITTPLVAPAIHTQVIPFDKMEEAEVAINEMSKGNAVTAGFNKDLERAGMAIAVTRLYRKG